MQWTTSNDWGSYEFTVSPVAIRKFEQKFGYRPTSEDFVNAGLYNNSYKVPSTKYRDWMDFINAFVVDFGRQCIDRIHAHGKKAFVFYNDHWIGMEPWGERFKVWALTGSSTASSAGSKPGRSHAARGSR